MGFGGFQMTRRFHRWMVLPALAAAAIAACSDAASPPDAEPAATVRPTPDRPGQTSDREPSPSGSEGLSNSSAAAETQAAPAVGADVSACIARVTAGIPPEIHSLLRDLTYTTAPQDACHSAHAVQRGDPEACALLSTAALRRGCRIRVAARTGTAEACPRDHRGERDATCLAWADRAPARCAAVGHSASLEASRCRAVLYGDADRCRELGVLRAGCEHDVAHMSAWLTEHQDRDLPPTEFEWAADVRTPAARDAMPTTVLFELSRGARVVHEEDCAAWLVFDAARLPVLAAAGLNAAVAHLALRVPPRGRGRVNASGIHLRVVTDDARTFDGSADDAVVSGQAEILQLASQRGGPFSVTVDAQVHLPAGTLSLRGRARAFLRDLEPAPASCAAETETESRHESPVVNP